MKKYFRLFNSFATCVFIFYIFPSCNIISITITGSDKTTGKLYLKDANGNAADTLKVDPKQTIKWKIGKEADVLSITELYEKTGSDNVFRNRARKKFLSKTWKAKVENLETLKEKLKEKAILDGDHYYFIEDYFIKWKDKTKNPHTYDPRIQVKS